MKLSKIAVTLSGVMLSGLVLSNPSFAKRTSSHLLQRAKYDVRARSDGI